MKRGQKGFGAIEALLFLILVSILGFTGYYVYHTRNNTNATYNTAASSSNNVPVSSSSMFVFKEPGLEFDLPADLKGLAYTVQKYDTGDAILLTLPAFKDANDKCYGTSDSGNGPSFASIYKGTGTFNQDQPDSGLLKQFNDSYVTISYPNGITIGCKNDPNDDSVQAAAHKYQQAFVNAFKATGTEVK